MYKDDDTGLEFMEAFTLACLVLWIAGGAFALAVLMMSGARG